MSYYKYDSRPKSNQHKQNTHRPHHSQNYIWVVYNLRQGRYHTFISKVQALQYYYNNERQCLSPEKRDH